MLEVDPILIVMLVVAAVAAGAAGYFGYLSRMVAVPVVAVCVVTLLAIVFNEPMVVLAIAVVAAPFSLVVRWLIRRKVGGWLDTAVSASQRVGSGSSQPDMATASSGAAMGSPGEAPAGSAIVGYPNRLPPIERARALCDAAAHLPYVDRILLLQHVQLEQMPPQSRLVVGLGFSQSGDGEWFGQVCEYLWAAFGVESDFVELTADSPFAELDLRDQAIYTRENPHQLTPYR